MKYLFFFLLCGTYLQALAPKSFYAQCADNKSLSVTFVDTDQNGDWDNFLILGCNSMILKDAINPNLSLELKNEIIASDSIDISVDENTKGNIFIKATIFSNRKSVADFNKDYMDKFATFSSVQKVKTTLEGREISQIAISPNPANNTLSISNIPTNVELIYIYDLQGNLVSKININGKLNYNLNISGLLNGHYILRFTGKEFEKTLKFEINK